MDVLSRIFKTDVVLERNFYEFSQKVMFKEDLSEIQSKLSHCMAQYILMDKSLEDLNKSNFEIKEELK